jgi:hypothetical protein
MDEMGKAFEEQSELELNDIVHKCLDSPGYVLFACYLSEDKEKPGKILNTLYKRYHLAFEDAFQSAKMFKNHILKDMIGGDEDYTKGDGKKAEGGGEEGVR